MLVDEGFAGRQRGALRPGGAGAVRRAVVLLLACASYSPLYLVSWFGERVVADLQAAGLRPRGITLSPAYFEVTRTGEILSRLTTDTTLLQSTVVGTAVSIALRNALLLLGGLGAADLVTSRQADRPGLPGDVPLVIVPILVFGRKVRRSEPGKPGPGGRRRGLHSTRPSTAIRTVQAFGHEGAGPAPASASMRVEQRLRDRRRPAGCKARALLTALVMVLVFGAVSASCLWIGGHDMLAGRISSGGDLARPSSSMPWWWPAPPAP